MSMIANRRNFLGAAGGTALAASGLIWAKSAQAEESKPDLAAVVDQAYAEALAVSGGSNADYIPALAKAPHDAFGIAIATAQGGLFAKGDTDLAFPIESISKVFTAALVMKEMGSETLRRKIGSDPTGLPFNSVEALELHGGRPLNPFVNAGAIATTSLVRAANADDRWNSILGNMADFAGRPLSVNKDVYASESETNTHNRGIAWLLKSYGYIYSDPDEALDVYTRQCSVSITTCDLATMGSVFASGGVHPHSGKRLIAEADIPPLMAEMALSGLYDASGTWLFEVGLPAKSGVAGGILAIAPGRYALAAFSPPLDGFGNSVRAQKAVASLARQLRLNIFAAPV